MFEEATDGEQHMLIPREVTMDSEESSGEDSVKYYMETSSSSSTGEHINIDISSVKRFNFMVAGGSGSGKTSFSISMLKRYFPLLEETKIEPESTSQIVERIRCEKEQGTAKIIVTVIDTPGVGDSLNNDDRIKTVLEYCDEQNRLYEDGEEFRRQDQENDSRIHCCFYFFVPHRVSALDCEFMKLLASKCPIIPIVAKADTYNNTELARQLHRVHQSLEEHAIKIFDFGETIDDTWLQDASKASDGEHMAQPPRRRIRNVFSVITGERKYPWCTVTEGESSFCDTPRLHQVLFKNEMMSLGKLVRAANDIHEDWRVSRETIASEMKNVRRTIRKKKPTMKLSLCAIVSVVVGLIIYPLSRKIGDDHNSLGVSLGLLLNYTHALLFPAPEVIVMKKEETLLPSFRDYQV